MPRLLHVTTANLVHLFLIDVNTITRIGIFYIPQNSPVASTSLNGFYLRQQGVVEEASSKGCWLFLPRICRVAILPRSRRMGSVNRQVCSSSPWKFPGMSVVQPIPMVHKTMVCSSTPPISFVLAPLAIQVRALSHLVGE